MTGKSRDINGNDSLATACANYRALDYWIRTYCTPGKPGPGVAEYEHASAMAALNDLKRLLRFGAVVDFVELSASYCKINGAYKQSKPP